MRRGRDLQEHADRPGRPCGTARSSAGTAVPSRTWPVARMRVRAGRAGRASCGVGDRGRRRPSRRRSRRRASWSSSASMRAGDGRWRAEPVAGRARAPRCRRRRRRRVPRRASRASSRPRAADLRALDVGLVERVDAEQPPGDRRRVLPEQHLRAERAADARPRPAGVDRVVGDPRRPSSSESRPAGPRAGRRRPLRPRGRVAARGRRAACRCRACRSTRR